MKISIKPDCANAPKKELIKKLTIAFAGYDLKELQPYFDEEIVWHLVGDTPIKGRSNFIAVLDQMKDNKVIELEISRILTHGKEAAVHGRMNMEDGMAFGFADFYEFVSAGSTKVKSITSYVIKL